ncbi:Concanavalin A-like lectin/glucanase domain containing protein [Parasponia andersonii]|uniref:Concanavalin A-like lectin/glucanase domain containing protein n=1 Tax=Parasponia andersonii TaxID=3476 RepID=A0A2P5A8A0_PARAD|nr:Concanavalin A-like lectin/glucanase domain containing protein [Parasponia andersonii]
MSSPAPDTSPPTNATPLLPPPPPSTPEATSPTLSPPTSLAPPPPATSLIQSPPPPPPGNGLPTGTMVGMIVGIGIGGMSMLVAVGVFFIFYRRYKMKKKMREQGGLEYCYL